MTSKSNSKNTHPSKQSQSLGIISHFKSRSLLTKFVYVLLTFIFVVSTSMYAIASWYRSSHADEPLQWGISWSFKYAEELGIDPREGFEAAVTELPIARVRLMSYWDRHEPENDAYAWDDLDWQVQRASEVGLNISLAIGLRQPRYPECHWPNWAQDLDQADWEEELNSYIGEVVKRYDSNPSIVEYQLENEFFLESFGVCPDHSEERLENELNLVRSLTDKTVILSRANSSSLSFGFEGPVPDVIGTSVYKRVFDTNTNNYFEFPLPAWFYAYIAGVGELTTGKESIIHELQAEPWGPEATQNLSLEEQNKTMDAVRLKSRLNYAEDTGIRTIDIWGAEWYYWRKTNFNDDSLWRTVRTEIPRLR